ncbi:PLP-dependent cysteine synthase family protein [Sphingomonas sp. HT-1]|uniref:PLP-dependent cysteine synthase family protein n=1 Tax=unclassified Sphingomonas TaxID=196159 RepID=UPI0002DFA854|nr:MULTISPECIES: PLP-dependent cysteine synthase family protein [unclassified Sphingomonas]
MLDHNARAAAAETDRAWVDQAVRMIDAEFTRSADTHLVRVELPGAPGITLYLKDESSHPTGSLKHRLGRSLFLYALCNGWIGPTTTIVEASSGSTAVSESYFARMIGLPFVAVLPRGTSPEKIAAIEFHGGSCHQVDDPRSVRSEAQRLAQALGGHFMDQFTYAERATDWRGNNNIAQSIFDQMAQEEYPVPRHIVCGAGTGGTSATIGRYIRYRRLPTQLCVADPEASVFHRHHADRAVTEVAGAPSCVEGIGRLQLEPSFLPDVIDRMIAVPDAASLAAALRISRILGRPCGVSTGTNIWACAALIREMRAAGQAGSIVTLLCDDGRRYASTCFDAGWRSAHGYETGAHEAALDDIFTPPPKPAPPQLSAFRS